MLRSTKCALDRSDSIVDQKADFESDSELNFDSCCRPVDLCVITSDSVTRRHINFKSEAATSLRAPGPADAVAPILQGPALQDLAQGHSQPGHGAQSHSAAAPSSRRHCSRRHSPRFPGCRPRQNRGKEGRRVEGARPTRLPRPLLLLLHRNCTPEEGPSSTHYRRHCSRARRSRRSGSRPRAAPRHCLRPLNPLLLR